MGELLLLIRRGLLCGFLSLSLAGLANAGTLTIDVRSHPHERPGFLCVVHTGPTDGRPIAKLDAHDKCPSETTRFAIGATGACLGVDKSPNAAETSSAFDVLTGTAADDSAKDPTCGADAARCAPGLSLERAGGVICARHPAQGPRVLVLQTRFNATRNPRLKSVDWSGDTGVLGFEPASGRVGEPLPAATVSVVGGDYTGRGGESDGGRVVASVLARCTLREVLLPRVALADLAQDRTVAAPSLRIRIDAKECTSKLAPAVPVLLPRTEAAVTKRVEFELTGSPARPDSEAVEWLLSTEWREAEPAVEVRADANRFQFQWRAGCEFMAGNSPTNRKRPAGVSRACPVAWLPEAGIKCSDEKSPQVPGELRCAYSCQVMGPGVRLPATVRFRSADGQDTWTETVSALGQTLTEYSQRERRYFPVKFKDVDELEKRRDSNWDKIEHVRLSTANGESFVFVPRSGRSYRIAVPGGTCGDQLEYQYVGNRDFDSRPIDVSNGEILIEPPKKSEKFLYFLLSLGGGAVVPFREDAPTDPFATLGLHARFFMPPATPIIDLAGLSYSFNFGRHRFKPAYGDGEEGVQYQRHFLTVSLSRFVSERFRVDISGGIGLGEPLYFQDSPKVGDRQWLVPLRGHLGFRIHRRIELEGGAGVILGDSVYGYQQWPENAGTPTVDTLRQSVALFTLSTIWRL